MTFVLMWSTGGGGSSYLVKRFRQYGWDVCERPDGGKQKANKTVTEIFVERTKPFFTMTNGNVEDLTQEQMCEITLSQLRTKHNTMLMSMSWGGMGLFENIEGIKPIYLVRNPVNAYVSYSGGGWRKEGGLRRMQYVGAENQNDKKWVDLFLGNFSHWKNGAETALRQVQNGTGHIIRYHKLLEDWTTLQKEMPYLPPVQNNFSSKDSDEKAQLYLNRETIEYIQEQTKDVWNQITQL